MVERALVLREYQHFWDGMIACVPGWPDTEIDGEDITPLEIISGELGDIAGPGGPISQGTHWSVNEYGPTMFWGRTADQSATWRDGAHDSFGGITEGTLIALINVVGSASNDSRLFGYTIEVEVNEMVFASNSAEVAVFEVNNVSANASGALTDDGWHLWVGRWSNENNVDIEVWDMATGQIRTSASNTGATTGPSVGGQLHVGNAPSATNGIDAHMAVGYAWDRALSDEDIQTLLLDPFGPIRPELSVFNMFDFGTLPLLIPARPIKPGRW